MSNIKEIYFKEISDHELLGREEEIELFKLLEVCDEEQAADIKDRIVNCNQRLVVKQAFRLINHGLKAPIMDMIQDGNMGLMKAIKKYKFWYGYKFSTYAVWWIRQTIQRGLQNTLETIRTPAHWGELQRKREELEHDYLLKHGKLPDDKWLANELNEQVVMNITEETLFSTILETRSLDTLGEPGGDRILEDCIESEDNIPEDEFKYQEFNETIWKYLDGLGKREKGILELRYGLKDDHQRTLKQVGKVYNISRERIRQIEEKAFRKIKSRAVRTGDLNKMRKSLDRTCK